MTETDPEDEAVGLAEGAPLPADRDWPRPWQPAFLRSLSLIPSVSAACRLARISRQTAYRNRSEQPAFADAWDEAIELAYDFVERQLHTWITTGLPVGETRTTEQYDADGKLVSSTTVTVAKTDRNATLMMFWLRNWKPDRYREIVRSEHTGEDGAPIRVESISRIDAQIEKLTAELAARGRESGAAVPVE